MIIEITRKTSSEQIAQMFKKLKNKKLFNAKKYCGAIHWKEDGVAYQKKMRNEWE
ncbi:MAG: hypothetical protein WCL06_15940 [Bacteroidota bacterium]